MISKQIEGSWTLSAFELVKDGESKPWGTNIRGLLIYTPTGHMSVSINKDVENHPEQSDAENLTDSILFYSGTYRLHGDVILHQVTNASNPARIGKELIRYPKLQGETLTLTSPDESFGRAILVWKRA